tara:strand:- start:1425 stop:2120 length:696 start_codon:yes stop_codon:yes gene_type:complete
MEIDKSEKERRSKLYKVFDQIKITGGTLVIGGDFFDFWFNYKHVIPSGYVDLLEQLDLLNSHGVQIHFILGNHDFWDFGYFNKKFGAQVYSGNLNTIHNKKKIQVCHGDGLLKNDHGYRIMKKIIRSPISISMFKLFHPDWGCRLAQKISKTSSEYHHHDLKLESIREELISYAKSQWELGTNIVLLGHYHQTGIIHENGNTLIFMGDWLRHFTITRLDENGWWQGKWDEL